MLLQFLHGADAPIGFIALVRAPASSRRLDALAHALGRTSPGDGVEADAVFAPFDCQHYGHGMDRRLAHRRGHHIGRTGLRTQVTVIDTTLSRSFGGDPAPAQRMRHVKVPCITMFGVNRIEPARGKVIGTRDEIAGGIVDARSVRGPSRKMVSIISSTASAFRYRARDSSLRPPWRSINSVAVSSQTTPAAAAKYEPRRRVRGSARPSICRDRCRLRSRECGRPARS